MINLLKLIKAIIKGNNTNSLVFDFHYHRLVLLPKLLLIKFPSDYKYYKFPTFQIL